MKHPWIAISAALCLAGCAVVEVVPPRHLHGQKGEPGTTPVAHIQARVWGRYLFKFIPILTGNPRRPDLPGMPLPFRHTVKLDDVMDMVAKRSRELGADELRDVVSNGLSGWNPFTVVFWINEYQVSANAVRRREP